MDVEPGVAEGADIDAELWRRERTGEHGPDQGETVVNGEALGDAGRQIESCFRPDSERERDAVQDQRVARDGERSTEPVIDERSDIRSREAHSCGGELGGERAALAHEADSEPRAAVTQSHRAGQRCRAPYAGGVDSRGQPEPYRIDSEPVEPERCIPRALHPSLEGECDTTAVAADVSAEHERLVSTAECPFGHGLQAHGDRLAGGGEPDAVLSRREPIRESCDVRRGERGAEVEAGRLTCAAIVEQRVGANTEPPFEDHLVGLDADRLERPSERRPREIDLAAEIHARPQRHLRAAIEVLRQCGEPLGVKFQWATNEHQTGFAEVELAQARPVGARHQIVDPEVDRLYAEREGGGRLRAPVSQEQQVDRLAQQHRRTRDCQGPQPIVERDAHVGDRDVVKEIEVREGERQAQLVAFFYLGEPIFHIIERCGGESREWAARALHVDEARRGDVAEDLIIPAVTPRPVAVDEGPDFAAAFVRRDRYAVLVECLDPPRVAFP